MPDDPEPYLTLRQADRARTDFAIIEDDIEALHARLARMPTKGDLATAALGIFCTVTLTLLGIAVFWPHGL